MTNNSKIRSRFRFTRDYDQELENYQESKQLLGLTCQHCFVKTQTGIKLPGFYFSFKKKKKKRERERKGNKNISFTSQFPYL